MSKLEFTRREPRVHIVNYHIVYDEKSGKYLGEVMEEEVKEEVKEEKAMRFNDGKLKWSLVHFKSIEPMVNVLMFGAKKYDAHNWKKGLDRDEILESTMRHLTALIDGEEIDPESGLPHIGHIQCNTMFYEFHHGGEKFISKSGTNIDMTSPIVKYELREDGK